MKFNECLISAEPKNRAYVEGRRGGGGKLLEVEKVAISRQTDMEHAHCTTRGPKG